MYLVYSALALAEIFALFVSAIGVLFLIVRGIVRALMRPKDEGKQPAPQSTHHLKRADARQSG